jgi:hypothetical protein
LLQAVWMIRTRSWNYPSILDSKNNQDSIYNRNRRKQRTANARFGKTCLGSHDLFTTTSISTHHSRLLRR